ncbi:MAG: membrane-bound lytic murein transglycosylase MltF [Gammaproteobacteria bacterium]|nr:membrane-bound lytic murein transglycosylase MltF [Gammaproteobacteria bacterium]
MKLMPIISKNFLIIIISVAITFALTACDTQDEVSSPNGSDSSPSAPAKKQNAVNKESIEEFRDWKAILNNGEMRALKLKWEQESMLPRSGSSALYHQQLFSDFANENGLTVRWVLAESLSDMLEKLKANKADIIPRHLTITMTRKDEFIFSRSITRDREVLLGKSSIKNFDLNSTNSLLLPKASAFIDTAKIQLPDWNIEYLAESMSSDDLADQLQQKEKSFTLLDMSSADTLLDYREDVKVFHSFSQPTEQGWLVNKNNRQLLLRLNNFISAHQLYQPMENTRTSDFSLIKKQKQPLRVITRNSPETYFLWRGELMGFEFDLMKEFTRRHDIPLQIIVAESLEEMTELLNSGKGDVIAAGLTRTPERQKEFQFSIRYNRVDELLVSNKDAPPISSKDDLVDRIIHIRKSSAFYETAMELSDNYSAKVNFVPESTSTEMLINQVAEGQIDLTIADSDLMKIEQAFRDEITAPLVLKEGVPYAYIVRKNNPELLQSLNQFIAKEYRQTFYNVIKQKYFSDRKRKEEYRENRVVKGNQLSPYDGLIKQYSQDYDFDWRLITSQMYQESKFNPNAKSFAGALGLMQVLPTTALELGFDDPVNPEQGIAAGVSYLNWTMERFDESLPVHERLFFALASYNAGYGHVKDAQKLAKQQGLNPNKWFNNVEKAMLLLQQPKYYKKTRFGYCRGQEPVDYVRNIHQRYLSYVNILN